MTGVPSQLSWVALWADVRVIGLVMALCAVGLAVLGLACYGTSTALTAIASFVAQVGRAVRPR